RERINHDYKADRERLRKLYEETVVTEKERVIGEEIGIHIKIGRLFTALVQRLNPVRRLVFFASLFMFLMPYVGSGFFINLMHPLAFFMLALLLFIELLEKLDAKKEIDLARDIQLSLLPQSDL